MSSLTAYSDASYNYERKEYCLSYVIMDGKKIVDFGITISNFIKDGFPDEYNHNNYLSGIIEALSLKILIENIYKKFNDKEINVFLDHKGVVQNVNLGNGKEQHKIVGDIVDNIRDKMRNINISHIRRQLNYYADFLSHTYHILNYYKTKDFYIGNDYKNLTLINGIQLYKIRLYKNNKKFGNAILIRSNDGNIYISIYINGLSPKAYLLKNKNELIDILETDLKHIDEFCFDNLNIYFNKNEDNLKMFLHINELIFNKFKGVK